jgi:hypothetical protein
MPESVAINVAKRMFPKGTSECHQDIARRLEFIGLPDLLEICQEAENTIRFAAQEATGRVKRELVGGWIWHADKLRAEIVRIKQV